MSKFSPGDIVTWNTISKSTELWYVNFLGSNPLQVIISRDTECDNECYPVMTENISLVCAVANRADIPAWDKPLDEPYRDAILASCADAILPEDPHRGCSRPACTTTPNDPYTGDYVKNLFTIADNMDYHKRHSTLQAEKYTTVLKDKSLTDIGVEWGTNESNQAELGNIAFINKMFGARTPNPIDELLLGMKQDSESIPRVYSPGNTVYSPGDTVKDYNGVMWDVEGIVPDIGRPIRVIKQTSSDSYDWNYFSESQIELVVKASDKPVANDKLHMAKTGEGFVSACCIPSVGDTHTSKDGELGKVTHVAADFGCIFVDTCERVPLEGDIVVTDDGKEGLAHYVDYVKNSFVLNYKDANFAHTALCRCNYDFDNVVSCSSEVVIAACLKCTCNKPCDSETEQCRYDKVCENEERKNNTDSRWNAVCKCGAPAYKGLMFECSKGCEAY